MSRSTTQWLILASITLAGFTSACTRADSTGPSEPPAPAFDERQGSNN